LCFVIYAIARCSHLHLPIAFQLWTDYEISLYVRAQNWFSTSQTRYIADAFSVSSESFDSGRDVPDIRWPIFCYPLPVECRMEVDNVTGYLLS